MIFELDNEAVTQAIREYCITKGLTSKPIGSMQFKTSRKGDKGTRVIITTQDSLPLPSQLELPLEAVVEPPQAIPEPVIQEEEVPDPPTEEPVPSTPFKKLF